MTSFYYDDTYPEPFIEAVRALAERDPDLLKRLEEGPRTSGQLECQLRVEPQERLKAFNRHANGLASTDPAVVLETAAALVADIKYMNDKAEAHRICQSLRPPIYRYSSR